jgi:hypothetical protein
MADVAKQVIETRIHFDDSDELPAINDVFWWNEAADADSGEVKLHTTDGRCIFVFIQGLVVISPVLNVMLTGAFKEAETREVQVQFSYGTLEALFQACYSRKVGGPLGLSKLPVFPNCQACNFTLASRVWSRGGTPMIKIRQRIDVWQF